MEASKFTEKIYGPYGDAWKVIKILAQANDDNPALSDVLTQYMSEIDKFAQKYEGNDFAKLLYKMLLKADDTIMEINRNEAKQKTEADK